jgi:hypothetical protein
MIAYEMGGSCSTVEINGKYVFEIFVYNREGNRRLGEAAAISRIL